MRPNNLQRYGGTVIFSKYYTASTNTDIQQKAKGAVSIQLNYVETTTEPIQYFFPKQNSVDALPADHDAWHKFDLLMEKLDRLKAVDDDLDDDWVSDLRSGSSSRLDEYED